jgi:ABC-2 type transport system ATP-binding protein
MRVAAFLRFAAIMKGLSGRAAWSAVERVASETGLGEVREQTIGRLSRGYRQRVGLAQALLGDPPVLLLDEPTAGLDPQQIAEVRALIRRLGAERTILLSTHILPEVSATCTRVIILARGRVVAIDEPQALAARAAGGRRVEVLVAGAVDPLLAALCALPGVVEARAAGEGRILVVSDAADDPRPEIARAILESGGQLLEMRGADRSLEEVFLDLVTDEARRG